MVPGSAPCTVKGVPPKNFHSYESISPEDRFEKLISSPWQIFVLDVAKSATIGSLSPVKQKLVTSSNSNSPPDARILLFWSRRVYDPSPLLQHMPSPYMSIITRS